MTGGTDQLATRFIAFLLPVGYSPPLMSGQQELPQELYDHAVAFALVDRQAVFRTISFAGYQWKVKASETLAGPGPNYFSARPEDVWVDESGRLHLRIAFRNERFTFNPPHASSVHRFDWQQASIAFWSVGGDRYPPLPEDVVQSWLYEGADVPAPGDENARINLWLFNGVPPSDGQEVEIVVESFQFIPLVE